MPRMTDSDHLKALITFPSRFSLFNRNLNTRLLGPSCYRQIHSQILCAQILVSVVTMT